LEVKVMEPMILSCPYLLTPAGLWLAFLSLVLSILRLLKASKEFEINVKLCRALRCGYLSHRHRLI